MTRPMRLVYVTARAPFGSNEAFVLAEAQALQALGHTVHLVPLRTRGAVRHASAAALRGAALAEPLLSWRVLAGALLEFVRAPAAALRALALLLTPKPRALLTGLAAYPKGLWLARWARALRIDHLHAHWATAPAAVAMVASRMTGIPWSFTAHRYDLEADHLLARKARHAAFVRVISEHGRSLAVRCGVPADRLVTLHMGVALPPPARVPGPQRAFRVLVPARLEAVKNHELILQAWARVRTPAELWLAGDGPLRAAVERRAAALGLRGVRLLGGLPHEALLDLYRCGAVDAALLASHVEGIPVALMEAMSFGLPAVCTEVGGVAELLGRGAGVLVAAGDAAALAEALEALARQPLRRQALGSAGRRRVAAAFRLDTIAAALARRFAAGAAQPETGTRGSEARAGAPSRLAATTVRRAS